jgi:hypothetical protein
MPARLSSFRLLAMASPPLAARRKLLISQYTRAVMRGADSRSRLWLWTCLQARSGQATCSGLRTKQLRLANRRISWPTLSANKKDSWPTISANGPAISANSLQTTLRTKSQCKEHSLAPVFQEKDCFGLNRRYIQRFKYQYPEINHRAKRSFNLETVGREHAEAC